MISQAISIKTLKSTIIILIERKSAKTDLIMTYEKIERSAFLK